MYYIKEHKLVDSTESKCPDDAIELSELEYKLALLIVKFGRDEIYDVLPRVDFFLFKGGKIRKDK